MLLSDLKDVLFGSFETQLASDGAVTSFATSIDALAKNVARNLDQRYVLKIAKKLNLGRMQYSDLVQSKERIYGVG
jgi:hypothetical protein